MSDFLLELRSEEIPARMQAKARDDLARLFTEEVGRAGLTVGAIETFSTPRRLTLIARDVPVQTEAVREETKGPKVGAPPQALDGFLRKTGLTQDQLEERDGVYFAVVERAGRASADVLADAIPAIIRAFPWPKSMRWGAASASTESLRWVRPLQGIVALLGDTVVACSIDGIDSGSDTVGHRFHSSGPVSIGSAADYAAKLRVAYVIVDHTEREALIREGAAKAARDAGLTLVADEGLVVENAGLTEWPVPLLGRFDAAYLDVPPEVIQLTARINQKYFICHDSAGKLANAFVCTANMAATDGGKAVVAGNKKVLAARLSDARFFWENDLKVPLVEQAEKLNAIVFHEKLGTVADKVERVAKLARWLVEEGIVKGDPAQAERAARLSKADLVTGMVGEFPELQGVIGGYLARAQGEPDAVADAIRDHYKPVGQGDDVPTAPVTVAVSLADKLDTITAFFRIEEYPTGSKDPFALRRAALAVIRLIEKNQLRFALPGAVRRTQQVLTSQKQFEALGRGAGDGSGFGGGESDLPIFILEFIADRLKVQQREAGVRHDLIDAVFALGQETGKSEDDLVRLLARVKALQAFIGTDDGRNLHAAYKRATRVIPADAGISPDDAGMGSRIRGNDEILPAERALLSALDAAELRAAAAIAAEDFAGAMAALASLRAPIDAFFNDVMVNDPDPQKRAFRIGLLQRFRDAVHGVADFSKIEG